MDFPRARSYGERRNSSNPNDREWPDPHPNRAQSSTVATSARGLSPDETRKRHWDGEIFYGTDDSNLPPTKRRSIDAREDASRGLEGVHWSRRAYIQPQTDDPRSSRSTERESPDAGPSRRPPPPHTLTLAERMPPIDRIDEMQQTSGQQPPMDSSDDENLPILPGRVHDRSSILTWAAYKAGYLRRQEFVIPSLAYCVKRWSEEGPVFEVIKGFAGSKGRKRYWRARVLADKDAGIYGLGDAVELREAIKNAALSACLHLVERKWLDPLKPHIPRPTGPQPEPKYVILTEYWKESETVAGPYGGGKVADESPVHTDRDKLHSQRQSTPPHHSKAQVAPSPSLPNEPPRREPVSPTALTSRVRQAPTFPASSITQTDVLQHLYLVNAVGREMRRLQSENLELKDSLQRADDKAFRLERELDMRQQEEYHRIAKQKQEDEARYRREQDLISSLEQAKKRNAQREEQFAALRDELDRSRVSCDSLRRNLKEESAAKDRVIEERNALRARLEEASPNDDPAVEALKEAFRRMEEVADSVLGSRRA